MEKMPGTGQREYWTFYTTSNDDKGGRNNSNSTDGRGSSEQWTVRGNDGKIDAVRTNYDIIRS